MTDIAELSAMRKPKTLHFFTRAGLVLALLACFTTPTVLLAAPGNVPIPAVESAVTLSAHDRMRVGLRYAMGDGVAADDLMAQQWFALSAKDGYAPAQVALASMKAFESDVQDVPGAIVLLRGAAARDNVQAQSELARLLSSSSNPAEVEEAKVWQDKAEAITRNQQLAWAWKQAAKGAEKWAVPAGSVADGKRLAQHVDSPDSKNLTLDIGAIGRAVEAGDNAARHPFFRSRSARGYHAGTLYLHAGRRHLLHHRQQLSL